MLLIPGSSADHPEKRWPVDRFIDLSSWFADMGITPVVIGGKAEGDIGARSSSEPRAKNIIGRTDLFQLATLSERAVMAIGGDTGPMHLAAAARTPGVCLFAQEWNPQGDGAENGLEPANPARPRRARGGPMMVLHAATLDAIGLATSNGRRHARCPGRPSAALAPAEPAPETDESPPPTEARLDRRSSDGRSGARSGAGQKASQAADPTGSQILEYLRGCGHIPRRKSTVMENCHRSSSPSGPPPKKEGPQINEDIRAPRVLLIDEKGEKQGEMPIEAALDAAREAGLDLVMVAPDNDPPVVKISDYGKQRFAEQKKKAEARKKQKSADLKEIKLRPNIDMHDYEVKGKAIRRFFEEGDKVKITMRFRGREMAHQNIGMELLIKVRGIRRRRQGGIRAQARRPPDGHGAVAALAAAVWTRGRGLRTEQPRGFFCRPAPRSCACRCCDSVDRYMRAHTGGVHPRRGKHHPTPPRTPRAAATAAKRRTQAQATSALQPGGVRRPGRQARDRHGRATVRA